MIYIDYTECKMSDGTSKSGGFNYIYHVITMLNVNKIIITLLIPEGIILNDVEEKIFNLENIKTQEIDSLTKIKLEENCTLFLPLLPISKLRIINKIKKRNPNSKVYLTIHGLRRLDLKYDKYDKYYYRGLKKLIYPVSARMSYYIGSVIYKLMIRIFLKKYDKILTVSNNTLQHLIKLCKPKYIKWFYQGETNQVLMSEKAQIKEISEKFILFVSGNRPEKNLLRFLLGFQKYKLMTNDNLALIITGVSEEKMDLLLRHRKIRTEDIMKTIKLVGYVCEDKLNELYSNAQFIVYPSKSEGFGLPVQEAIMRRKPVLASYITAIPEVSDSMITYHNPYSIDSIYHGLLNMSKNETQRQLIHIDKKRANMIERINLSNEDLLYELTEYEKYGE